MGHLDRYKKTGGFLQLLALIESFPSAKREKFLTLIEEENPLWSKALRDKLISVERVFTWPPHILTEIAPKLPLNILVMALHGLKPEQTARLFQGLPSAESRKIQSEMETTQPTPAEIATTHQKIIETVRKMVAEGELRIDQFDPQALIDEKFEEQLLQSPSSPQRQQDEALPNSSSHEDNTINEGRPPGGQDLKALQILMLNLQKENKILKNELKVLKEKLETIRKIA